MALAVGNVGDNPFQPGVTAEAYLPDQLIAGDFKLVTQDFTVKLSAALLRGTVMGRILLGAATSAVKGGGNTGTGTFVPDAVTSVLANAQAGIYTLRCTVAAANSGTFRLTSPTGVVLGDFTITGGAGGTVLVNDQIKGVLTDGGVDFIVGDGFDVTVQAGSGKIIKAVATALDGSAAPIGILMDDCDASAADQNASCYLTGEFNSAKLIFDASFSVATLTPLLRPLSIFLKTPITASDPT